MYASNFKLFLVTTLVLPFASVWAMPGLSLQQAEQIALQRDAIIKSYEQKSLAFMEQSKGSTAWPDPKIKFGAQAVPVDSFDLEQEPMTQIVLGYQQQLPRGDSYELAAQSMSAMSRMQNAKLHLREREVLMKVRHAWLDVVLQNKSIKIIHANRHLFVKMLDISEAFYAAGRQQQQDVVQAQLEISLIDDRLEQAYSKLIEVRANLAKWVGEENMQGGVDPDQVDLPLAPLPSMQQVYSELEHNPEITALGEEILSQQKKLEIANEQYAPQWGFDINYGKRSGDNLDGSERADFLTAMVTLDLPLFTGNKQDRIVMAEKQRLQAARFDQLEVKRMLTQRLQEVMGRLQKLHTRHQLYKQKVLPQSRQNSAVSLSGYQSGEVSFFTLTRARITELNTHLSDLQINVAYNKTYAELEYLVGEK